MLKLDTDKTPDGSEKHFTKQEVLEMASSYNLHVQNSGLYFMIEENMMASVPNNSIVALIHKQERGPVHLKLKELMSPSQSNLACKEQMVEKDEEMI
jgi:hypothetical protein